MKVLFVLIVVVFPFVAGAQTGDLFKILKCSNDVTITDVITKMKSPITPGMIISGSKNFITVPKNGHAWAVSDAGRVGKLKIGKTKTQDVGRSFEPKTKFHAYGSVRFTPLEIELPMVRWHDKADFTGDTLFLYWTKNSQTRSPDAMPVYQPAQIKTRRVNVSTIFGDTLASVDVSKNWVLIDLPDTTKFILYELKNPDGSSLTFEYLVTRIPRVSNAVTDDIAALGNNEDRLFYECVLYQINDLVYDQSLTIYKILSQKKQARDPFMMSYFEKLSAKYGLHTIDLE